MPVFRDSSSTVEDAPPCWGFADGEDPACRQCDLFQKCLKATAGKRPPCYGTHSEAWECAVCILASTCKEVASTKGGKRSKTSEKTPYRLEDAMKELSSALEDTLEESRYDGLSKAELKSLAKDRGLPSKGSVAKLKARLTKDDNRPPKKLKIVRRKK